LKTTEIICASLLLNNNDIDIEGIISNVDFLKQKGFVIKIDYIEI